MRRAGALLVGLAMTAALVAVAPASVAADDVDRLLERALTASRERPHTGSLVIASFSSDGPQVTRLDMATSADGGLRLAARAGWEMGRTGEHAFLRQPGTLLRVGGTERVPFDIALLRSKYAAHVAGDTVLDTGPATVLRLEERATGVHRESLYLDADTELVVRRETFDLDGAPVRVVAFTELTVGDASVQPPDPEGLDVVEHALLPTDVAELRARGFTVPESLPHGYQLVARHEVEDARVPTLHLTYADGLYTLSLFEQQGRLSMRAVRQAEARHLDGGTVWRWPGSEPRRVIWTGDGSTFTALTDAPTDELLAVIGALPVDASPSILERLARGLNRVWRWVWPGASVGPWPVG